MTAARRGARARGASRRSASDDGARRRVVIGRPEQELRAGVVHQALDPGEERLAQLLDLVAVAGPYRREVDVEADVAAEQAAAQLSPQRLVERRLGTGDAGTAVRLDPSSYVDRHPR